MTQTKIVSRNDDKAFVVLTLSRNDVREMCGQEAADSLSDEDMQRLAEEMADYCFDDNFIEALRQTIEEKFSESSKEANR